MRTLGAALLALALAAPARAQESPPALGDVPGGAGAIHGRVRHGATGTGVGGADVVLYSIGADGIPGARRATSGADGGFRFENVSSEPSVAYLLGARYQDVPFVGERVAFAPGESDREVEMRVWERTRDASQVSVEETSLRLARVGAELAVAEVHRLRNDGERVVYALPGERSAGAAALRARLPAGVTRFALPYALEPEGLVRDGPDVRFYGPVYPGVQEIAFTYALPLREGRSLLEKAFPSATARLAVLLPPVGFSASAAGLTPADDVELDGSPHRALHGGPLAAGARLALALDVPVARRDPAALSLVQTRSFVELDDAALSVTSELHLEVSGESPVVGAEGVPLLRLPIPAGARDLRFSAPAVGGIGAEEGALVVHGPVPAGASRIDLAYRLPASGAPVRFDQSFDRRVPLAAVFVADTGLAVESARLHRRRPVQAGDERLYQHFEAFHVEPGETLDLALTPLARARPLPRSARAALVVAAALALAFFLGGPLRGRAPAARRAAEPDAGRQEREALYAALRDLEHDFETGKLAADDFARMRDELRARAAALLRAESPARAAPQTPAPASATACPACGAAPAPDARFCAQCGARLGAEPAWKARA